MYGKRGWEILILISYGLFVVLILSKVFFFEEHYIFGKQAGSCLAFIFYVDCFRNRSNEKVEVKE